MSLRDSLRCRTRRQRASKRDAVEKHSVPYRQLFRYATKTDKWYYALACVAACGNGVIFPLFALTIGEAPMFA